MEEPARSTVFEPHRRRTRTPSSLRIIDGISEGVIYFLVVFTPWAFGTTQTWSIWTANIASYVLGALLIAKWIIRWQSGSPAARWGDGEGDEKTKRMHRAITVSLAALTVFMLAYIMAGAVNARAEFLADRGRFEFNDDFRKWLPHSYDSVKSWAAFWNALGMALFFWALRDWLLGKTPHERRKHRADSPGAEGDEEALQGRGEKEKEASPEGEVRRQEEKTGGGFVLPQRLKRVLWVLCINGGVLGLEGILQRLSGTNELLWLLQPRLNRTGDSQFGPWAYRANGATYFNLLWPVCLGFWLVLRQEAFRARHAVRRIGAGSHVVLLPCAVLMASCPIITTSRGGAIICVAQLIVASALIAWSLRRESSLMRAGFLSVFLVILLFSGFLGWKDLAKRMETVFVDQMSQRTEIYETSVPIARDFPVFGTGAGTFGSVYFLYREPKQNWAAYVHDDWLETRITLGWIGFAAALGMFLLAVVHWFGRTGISVSWEFAAVLWLSLGGFLLHAKFDFPMQIYSLLLPFLVFCAVSSCVGRRPWT